MAAVVPKPKVPGDGGAPTPPTSVARQQMDHLLNRFIAAKPLKPDSFVPGYGMQGGGDVQLQPGLYTASLVGPDVWPSESETELAAASDQLAQLANNHRTASAYAKSQSDQVFSGSWTAGDGAAAAQEHYWNEHQAHEHLIDVLDAGSAGMGRLSEDVGRTKRLIREAHDNAHQEIEALLKSNGALGIAYVAPILTTYRTLINEHSAELRGYVASETKSLTNKFGAPEAPPKAGDGDGRGKDGWTGNEDPKGHSKPDSSGSGGSGSGDRGHSPFTPSQSGDNTPTSPPGSRGLGSWSPSTAPTPSGPGRPSIPSLPSTPSAPGGGASPLSGAASGGMGPLSGLLGGGSPAGMASNVGSPASSVQGQTSRAMQSAFGGDFGRGLAAASNAAVGPIPPAQPVPQAPASPLAAPAGGTASPAAAPATMSAPAPAAVSPVAGGGPMGVPASAGGPAGAQMTSYGSVLPPASGVGAPVPGGGAGLSGPPPATAPPPPPVGGPPPGFVPVSGGAAGPARLGRDYSMTDLENARKVVADLAAASSVVYPGLEWAVGVARGVSGQPELWIATNEGAGYIPAGVFVPRSMPLAARFDPGFDERWFGWFNPAETVLRAIQAHGDTISAVATTFMSRSELVDESVSDVAVGVPASGGPGEAEAAQLLRSRSHRLETVAPGLYLDLMSGDPGVVDAYVRHVTQQAVFNCGTELSAAAQAVARGVVSGRWPASSEWSALRDEYSAARLMAGSQRPGVIGIEDPQQSYAYRRDFAECRRMEVLMSWETGTPADVVYAAWCAGAPTPSLAPLNV